MRPNVFSETFSPYAAQIVRTDEEARRALKDLGKSRKAHLRLAFPSTCSQYGIAEIISTFAKLSPPVSQNRFSEFTPAERTNVFCVCELFNPPLN